MNPPIAPQRAPTTIATKAILMRPAVFLGRAPRRTGTRFCARKNGCSWSGSKSEKRESGADSFAGGETVSLPRRSSSLGISGLFRAINTDSSLRNARSETIPCSHVFHDENFLICAAGLDTCGRIVSFLAHASFVLPSGLQQERRRVFLLRDTHPHPATSPAFGRRLISSAELRGL